MGIRWERVFELGFERDRVWRAWADPEEIVNWMEPTARRVGHDRFESRTGDENLDAGTRLDTEILEVDRPDRLRWRYKQPNWPDWVEVSVVFQDTSTGTRITMTHAGFGDDEAWAAVIDQLEGRVLGWSEAIADLAIYLDTGIATHRHFTPGADLGVGVTESDIGLHVHRVDASGAGDRAGLEPGDLLVTVDRVPVFRRGDLLTITRVLADREGDVEVAYSRAGHLETTSCALHPATAPSPRT